ncbi:hypothetical protein [Pedobacter sp. D749]|uniref:hypothetical protein n=1 Tax=Pedobacter sp. D749 TaxID=2856523 RepID=UPI001C578613|nr:hypothetical protein [Pedobacter sp. D749]QXU42875.1 hypothetical protein KYH19_04545 [Pedobacter sp. D749]
MKTLPLKEAFFSKASIVRQHLNSALAILCFIIVSMCLSGCSKDDNGGGEPTGDYYFRAKIGEKEVNFHNVNFQGSGDDNRFEHIVVGGYESSYPLSGPIPPSLDFEIWRLGGNIAAGTYVTPAENKMIARYAIQKTEGTLLYNTSFSDDVFTLKIEAISKSGIKGAFSGTVRNSAGEAIEITGGTFNLPYETTINP